MIIYSDNLFWSDISLNRDLVTAADLITVFDAITLFREVSIGHLQRMRLANSGRLLLTPAPLAFVRDRSILNLSCVRTFWVSNIPRYFFFAYKN